VKILESGFDRIKKLILFCVDILENEFGRIKEKRVLNIF